MVDAPGQDGTRFVRAFGSRIWRRSVAAALMTSTAISVVSVTGVGVFFSGEAAARAISVVLVIAVCAFSSSAAIGWVIIQLATRRALSFIPSAREPTPTEVSRIAKLPRFSAKFVAGSWLFSVPLMMLAADLTLDHVPWQRGLWEACVLIFGFAALAAAMGSYLLVEQVVRPILSGILPADPDEWPKTIGLTSRLVLASVVVSVAPLVVIGLTFGRLTVDQRAAAGPTILSGGLLFAALSFFVFAIAGRTITNPLEGLRTGMKRVADGQLDVNVDAVEGGEIGLLQVGFNQMLDGLRERERMRDVFGRHVGTDVARRALETDFASEGELVRASALFVDVVGSTAFTERTTPAEVVSALNEFFDKIVSVIAAEGGMINKFMGDGALCLFGAPTPMDDHAARALRAARALCTELATLDGIGAAIGVGSGDVVAGNVGTADRYEFTVIGDAVNEASRLCDAAKQSASRVLASDRAIAAAGDEAAFWLRAETMQLRGKSKPTVTYIPAVG